MLKKPNFFIVGARKSGTTALYNYLKLHPDIFMSDLKEPNFFATDFSWRKVWFDNKIKNYLSLFSKVKNQKAIGEASNTYLSSRTAAKEIKKFAPGARIIIILRNPIDQMYASHSQSYYNGEENIMDFEKALNAEIQRKNEIGGDFKTGKLFYRDMVAYYKQVKRYSDLFKPEKIHIIIFEEMLKDTNKTYKRLLKFLNVDDNFKLDFKEINSNRTKNSNKKPRIWIINYLINRPSKLVRSVGRRYIDKNILWYLLNYVKKINTIYEKRTPMPPVLRRKLIKEFTPEIKKLGKLIKKDLSYWYE
ncbi:MAG TPA: sulfotransferase [Patescibacteria group bacterium]|nr:sulfotransferase [Patescibacteria group bacterium]